MLNENNFIGFYNENEEYGFLSNWYKAPFEYAGRKYANSEQYMMFQKAMAFSQWDTALQILKTEDPKKCKELGGQKFKNWDTKFWDKIKYRTVRRGIKAKFVQNPEILSKLLATGNVLLAECSEKDTNWGIGIGMKDDARFDVSKWKGDNYLGRILMDVREELRMLQLMAPGRRQIKYRDAMKMPMVPQWEMTFGELMRIPKYRKVVEDYVEIFNRFCGNYLDIDLLVKSPAEIDMTVDGMNGYPLSSFKEMKQDLYETVSDMWILGSGFDAPMVGRPLPKGAKLVKDEDGYLKIILPGEEE